ncbi:MAG: hypothetical protein R6W91_07270 [Thermoplasmata archaeon]
MSHKFVCALLVMLLASLALQPVCEAQVTSVMTISMGGMVREKVVAGIIHNVTVTPSQASDDVVIRAYLSTGFTVGNITNNYSWSYSSGVWADDLYGYYIRNESAKYGNSFSLHLALDSQAIAGTWRFVTMVGGVEASNRQVTVETPVAGISMSAPTFYFHVERYWAGQVSSWKPDNVSYSEYLTTRNIGNVPLTPQITFEGASSFSFSATNASGTYPPNEQRQHFISFQAQSWSPRKFSITGYVSGEPQLVMTPNTVSTIIAPRTTFEIVVTVARPGYDVYQMDGVTVQYKSFYYSAYKQKLTLDMYVTGNKSVYMGQEMQNLTFVSFRHEETDYKEDILLVLADDVEQHVAVNLTCSSQPPWKQPSMIANAHFTLRLADNSGTGMVTSNVVVSATPESGNENPITANMLVILALIIVFIVIGLFLFKIYRKTEEERRKELEERIRKKKERTKKQRRR